MRRAVPSLAVRELAASPPPQRSSFTPPPVKNYPRSPGLYASTKSLSKRPLSPGGGLASARSDQSEPILISRLASELDARFSGRRTHRAEEEAVRRLETRATELEDIIGTYLSCREKPPFSRRELINLFRAVIDDLRRASERLRDQKVELRSMSGEVLRLSAAAQGSGLLEAKKNLEASVQRLRVQLERKNKEITFLRDQGAEELRKLRTENSSLREGVAKVEQECQEALAALERKELNRRKKEQEDAQLFEKLKERAARLRLPGDSKLWEPRGKLLPFFALGTAALDAYQATLSMTTQAGSELEEELQSLSRCSRNSRFSVLASRGGRSTLERVLSAVEEAMAGSEGQAVSLATVRIFASLSNMLLLQNQEDISSAELKDRARLLAQHELMSLQPDPLDSLLETKTAHFPAAEGLIKQAAQYLPGSLQSSGEVAHPSTILEECTRQDAGSSEPSERSSERLHLPPVVSLPSSEYSSVASRPTMPGHTQRVSILSLDPRALEDGTPAFGKKSKSVVSELNEKELGDAQKCLQNFEAEATQISSIAELSSVAGVHRNSDLSLTLRTPASLSFDCGRVLTERNDLSMDSVAPHSARCEEVLRYSVMGKLAQENRRMSGHLENKENKG